MPNGDPFALGRDLAQTPLANVLIAALKQKVTGELCIRARQGEDRIYFRAGVPTGTLVMHAFQPLGRMLRELGWITDAQLEDSIAQLEHGKRQGDALIEAGALTPERLEQGLRLQQLRNLTAIARLSEGGLAFDNDSAPPDWEARVKLNALVMLREVLAVPESAPVCETLFQKTGEDTLFVIPPHLVSTGAHFEFEPDEQQALRLLEAPMTLGQFLARSHLPENRARALVAELIVTNLLVPPEKAVPEGADQLVPQLDEQAQERRRRLRQRAIASVGGGMLGRRPPPRPASPRRPTQDLPPMAEGPGGRVDGYAYGNAEERSLRALIEEKTRLLPTLDYYGRLGLTAAATKEQVKTAFVQAAKLFHPDHLPQSLADLAPLQREIFGAIKEAYDTLCDDVRAREYKAQHAAPPPARHAAPGGGSGATAATRARDDEAKTLAQQGETAMRRRDYPSAAENFRQAYELSREGDYLACEAWALYSDPARKADQQRSRDLLEEAGQKHADSEKAQQYLGVLARIEGRNDEAQNRLRRALAINPRNIDVANELHLLELRRR